MSQEWSPLESVLVTISEYQSEQQERQERLYRLYRRLSGTSEQVEARGTPSSILPSLWDKTIGGTFRKLDRNARDHLMFRHGMFGAEISYYKDQSEKPAKFFRGTVDTTEYQGIRSK